MACLRQLSRSLRKVHKHKARLQLAVTRCEILIAVDATEVAVGHSKEAPSVLLVPPPTLCHFHHGT